MSDDRVYIAISRPEGYEDVHPDIVIDDWVREAGWNEWEHVTDEIERLRRLRDECRTVLRGDDDSMPADIHPADAARRRMDELASLRAEVAALKEAKARLAMESLSVTGQWIEATGEVAALRADAERYRYIKDAQVLLYKPAGYDGMKRGRWDCMEFSDEQDLDRFIDAARGAKD